MKLGNWVKIYTELIKVIQSFFFGVRERKTE